MKKLILILLILYSPRLLADFSKKTTVAPKLVQKGDEKQWCPITGFKISDFYKTSYIAQLKSNGRYRQYSCIYALLSDKKQNGIDIKSIKVLDIKKQNYIDVQKAYFLVDSSMEATFGRVSTVAFANKATAIKFSNKYGGRIVDFKKAIVLAQINFLKNLSYMQNIYRKKYYPMGKRIYDKNCKKIELDNFLEINELEGELSKTKICTKLNQMHLLALALYLWDVKRSDGVRKNSQKIIAKEDEKCPVCGMFVYKYPRWITQIFYKDGDYQRHLSFDGVKDMMKFYFNNKKWVKYNFTKRKNITKMLVTDYYKQKAINATKAYFVVGSNIYGPMGNEFVPFESFDDAKNFKIDHKGIKILKFSDIKEKMPYNLDTK